MENKFRIKHFRIFKEKTEFDMAPITILTGKNSAGKSTLAKAILLIEDFLKQGALDKNGCCITNYELDLEKFRLGRFKDIQNPLNYPVEFEYDVFSPLTASTWSINYRFNSFDNGRNYLDFLSIKNKEGKILLSVDVKLGKLTGDLNIITVAFRKFLIYQSYMERRRYSDEKVPCNISKEDISVFSEIPTNETVDFSLFNILKTKTELSKTEIVQKYISDENSKWSEGIFWLPIFSQLKGKNKKETIESLLDSLELNKTESCNRPNAKSFLEEYEKSECEIFEDFFYDYIKKNAFTISEYNFDPINYDYDIFRAICSAFMWDPYKSNNNLRFFLDVVSKNKISENCFGGAGLKRHKIHYLFINFLWSLLKSIVFPKFIDNITYLPTDRIHIHRLYTTEDSKDDFAIILRKYRNSIFKSKGAAVTFLNKWLKEFEIAKELEIKETNVGSGLSVYLKRGKTKRLLADEGYGITQLVSILLNISYCILTQKTQSKYDKEAILSTDFLVPQKERIPHTIIIEEPEIHLHPALQSKLADLFYEAYKEYNIHFIIETHSEYLIRKSQVLVSKMGFISNVESNEKSPFRTYYIPQEIGEKPYSLVYRKDGRFAESFGPGFFDVADKLAFDII